MLKAKVTSFFDEVEEAQDSLKTLERDMNIKKAFSKLKDKQIDNALHKIQKANPEVVEKFKKFDEYSNKLCDYYVDGFEFPASIWPSIIRTETSLLLTWRQLRREIRANRPSTGSTAGNVDDRMEDDVVVTAEAPMDPSSSNPTWNTSLIFGF